MRVLLSVGICLWAGVAFGQESAIESRIAEAKKELARLERLAAEDAARIEEIREQVVAGLAGPKNRDREAMLRQEVTMLRETDAAGRADRKRQELAALEAKRSEEIAAALEAEQRAALRARARAQTDTESVSESHREPPQGRWEFDPSGKMTAVLLLILAAAMYFLPAVIAIGRSHHNAGSIVIVNVFFGWTFLGWVIALAMSFSHVIHRNERRRQARPYYDEEY